MRAYRFGHAWLLAGLIASLLSLPASSTAAPWDGKRFQFAAPRFETVWRQADQAVQTGRTTRSWTWGPKPWFDYYETYLQAPNGLRQVQYFDKARMEINNPASTSGPLGGVTNGLLPVELISGRVKVGDGVGMDQNILRGSSTIQVAGDIDPYNTMYPPLDTPTYTSFTAYATIENGYRDLPHLNQTVSAWLNKDGVVSQRADLAADQATKIVSYEQVTGHNIPQIFQTFLDRSVTPAIAAFGYPITDPYWIAAKVGGQPRTVLVQIFERRVLTYTPSNPEQYKVEMGNVGQHYWNWRYGSGQPWITQDPALAIVYASKANGATFDVYRINPDGSNPNRMSNGTADTIPWSIMRTWETTYTGFEGLPFGDTRRMGDHQQLAISGVALPRHSDLIMLDRQTMGNDTQPAMSPAGGRLMFVSDASGRQQIYVSLAGENAALQLTTDPNCRHAHPSWLPNGTGLVYERQCTGEPTAIYRADLRVLSATINGEQLVLINQQRLSDLSGDDRWPRVAPDGSQIAFMRVQGGTSDIYTMRLDGSQLRQITTNPGRDEAPTWSPDSQQLAFNSDRDGDFELFVMRSDGSQVTQLTFNTAEDGYPVWAN